MAREYGKALTKEMLVEWGFYSIDWDPENNEWWIDRYWYHCNSKTKIHKKLSIQNAVCRHKYTYDKYYPIVTFSFNQKVICLPLARIIYAWFTGPIEAKEVIDHIDNNPYNNRVENLQKLSVGENLAKRFIDNPKCNVNQYTVNKNIVKNDLTELVHKLKEMGKTYEEALEIVAKFIK